MSAVSTKLLVLLAALLLLAFAGCGDGGGGDATEAGGDAGGEEAAIVVESPEAGASVSSPVTVSGTASVFEGTVALRILDAGNQEIARGFATASAGAPERGTFSEEVEFAVDEPQEGVIEVFEQDVASPGEGGGAEPLTVEVPVQLEP